MAERGEFLERVKRELSAQELAELKTFSAHAPRGSVIFVPIIRKFGGQIEWQSRVQIKGAMGPLLTNKATLAAIGAPADWNEKAKGFLEALQAEYPALPAFPERKALPKPTPE